MKNSLYIILIIVALSIANAAELEVKEKKANSTSFIDATVDAGLTSTSESFAKLKH
jgi:hypothetical protein